MWLKICSSDFTGHEATETDYGDIDSTEESANRSDEVVDTGASSR